MADLAGQPVAPATGPARAGRHPPGVPGGPGSRAGNGPEPGRRAAALRARSTPTPSVVVEWRVDGASCRTGRRRHARDGRAPCVERGAGCKRTVGVLGHPRRAQSASSEESFITTGSTVRIAPAASALRWRVRRSATADRTGWLVVVTDRTTPTSAPGLLAQLVGQRLRHPDPWQAVRQRFRAQRIDPAPARCRGPARSPAAARPGPRAADGRPRPAACSPATTPRVGWPRADLGLPLGAVDPSPCWSGRPRPACRPPSPGCAGEAATSIVDAVLGWVAENAGAGTAVGAGPGRPRNRARPRAARVWCWTVCSPRADRHQAELALARLQHRWGSVPGAALSDVGQAVGGRRVGTLLGGRVEPGGRAPAARRGPTRWSAKPRRASCAGGSTSASAAASTQRLLGARRRTLRRHRDPTRRAKSMPPGRRSAATSSPTSDARVTAGSRRRPARAVAAPSRTPPASDGLAALAERHLAVDAWVDSAINDAGPASTTTSSPKPWKGAQAAHARRDAHDLRLRRGPGGGRLRPRCRR